MHLLTGLDCAASLGWARVLWDATYISCLSLTLSLTHNDAATLGTPSTS